jgi:predicted Zn-dependent peptidase
LLHTVLGENMSSRLFQRIREDKGLAYSIYSSPSFFQDTGDLVVYAGLEAGNLNKALRLVIREFNRLRSSPVSKAELMRARDYVMGQIDLALESTEAQMNWVGEQWLGYRKILPPQSVKKRLEKITPAEIQAAARAFFRPERLNLAIVSPLKKDQGIASTLAQLDA